MVRATRLHAANCLHAAICLPHFASHSRFGRWLLCSLVAVRTGCCAHSQWLLCSLVVVLNGCCAHSHVLRVRPLTLTHAPPRFFLDVISILPFDVLMVAAPGLLQPGPMTKSFKLIRIMRLIKLMRVLRASRIIQRWENSISISYSARCAISPHLPSGMAFSTLLSRDRHLDGPRISTDLADRSTAL